MPSPEQTAPAVAPVEAQREPRVPEDQQRRGIPAFVLAVLTALAGCGSISACGRDQDARPILNVMRAGRLALLRGDGRAACSLLTPRGRQRVLGFQVDYLPEGAPVPSNRRGVPHTCEQIVRRQWRDEHRRDAGQSWIPDLKRARFRVLSIAGARAKVELYVPVPNGPKVLFRLRQIGGRWRVDDSPAVPSGY